MPTILIRVTYRIRAHNIERFEAILLGEILPIARDLGITPPAIWKGFLGEAGEFMELWNFESLDDFEKKWRALMAHPLILKIFQKTGPLVEDENLSVFEPLGKDQTDSNFDFHHYSV